MSCLKRTTQDLKRIRWHPDRLVSRGIHPLLIHCLFLVVSIKRHNGERSTKEDEDKISKDFTFVALSFDIRYLQPRDLFFNDVSFITSCLQESLKLPSLR